MYFCTLTCCFQCVKGNKFESDSQHSRERKAYKEVVSNVSKVINLKAIHNIKEILRKYYNVVSNVSKVINLKAIHNTMWTLILSLPVVSNVSKVINLKAIHNFI